MCDFSQRLQLNWISATANPRHSGRECSAMPMRSETVEAGRPLPACSRRIQPAPRRVGRHPDKATGLPKSTLVLLPKSLCATGTWTYDAARV